MSLIKSFGNMKLVDISTGKEVCEIKSFNDFHQPNIQSEMSADYKPSISFTLEDAHFEPEVLEKLLSQNPLEPKYDINIKGNREVFVQARTHKKKRINKKWLKKYGLKAIYIPFEMSLTECKLTQEEYDSNTYSIEGKL